jgi:outer membrane protein assembly factor BamB
LFVSTGFGLVIALDAVKGKQIWKADLGVPIVNAPVANSGRVFVSSHDNHFYALAESDGRKLWDHQGIAETAGVLASTSAAVAGEYVIAPYTSGELYALRVQNGRAAWNDMLTRSGTTTALSELDDIAGRPVVDRDMVFAISHSGVMAAINLNTGERVWARDIAGIQTPWMAGDFGFPPALPRTPRRQGEVDSPTPSLAR